MIGRILHSLQSHREIVKQTIASFHSYSLPITQTKLLAIQIDFKIE